MAAMTAAQQAKAAGLKGLAEAVQITGVSYQTLGNWHKKKPELFKTVIYGCLMVRFKESQA